VLSQYRYESVTLPPFCVGDLPDSLERGYVLQHLRVREEGGKVACIQSPVTNRNASMRGQCAEDTAVSIKTEKE
jgi:hypothetical protein